MRPSKRPVRPERPAGQPDWLLALLATVLAATIGCSSPQPAIASRAGSPWSHDTDLPTVAAQLDGQVLSIVDGDTITVALLRQTVTVRLLGIDTPEKAGGPRPAECYGSEATRFLEQLIPVGSQIGLTRDLESRDQYGRLLAWVHRDDGVFVNLAMVESGHAEPLFFPPNDTLEPLFADAGWEARRAELGFWTACGGADVTLDG